MSMEGDKNVEQVCESISMIQPGNKLCSGFSLQQSNSCYEDTSSYSDVHCYTNVDVDDNASKINKVMNSWNQKCSLLSASSQVKLIFDKTVLTDYHLLKMFTNNLDVWIQMKLTCI